MAVRLLLVQAPFRDTFGYSMPPPGLLRLGGELKRLGIDVELEDLAFRQARGELANGSLLCESATRLVLKRGEHDLIGLSVMGATLPAALEIARRVRELRPTARLILGGPGTTGCSELLLERFDWIDAVVRGEAEASLPEVMARFEESRDLDGVLGVSWRDASGEVRREADRPMLADLGTLAPYAWELLPKLADYKAITGELEGLTPIDSGRGCAYDCSFCTIGRFWSRRSRCLPAAKLVDEVHALDHIEGARNAYLCHDIFGADRAQAVAFCEGMLERGTRPWECRARVDHLDEELVELMGRAGCYRVLLGVESASHAVRELANKNQPSDLDVLAVVERCGRAGIRPILSLILGLPGEEEAELEESLSLLSRAALTADVVISLHLPNPQPGCGLHETHAEGARQVEGIPPDMAFGSGETAPERALIEAHPDLFSSWSLLAGDLDALHELHRMAEALPELLQHYPRSWELSRRARGESHLEQFRAWSASRKPFADFAVQKFDGLLLDALAWEGAVRALDGALPRFDASEEFEFPGAVAYQTRSTVVRLAHDLPALTDALARGVNELDSQPRPTTLAVTPFPGGVRTDRVSADVVRLLELLERPRAFAELQEEHPGIEPALEALLAAQLIRKIPLEQR